MSRDDQYDAQPWGRSGSTPAQSQASVADAGLAFSWRWARGMLVRQPNEKHSGDLVFTSENEHQTCDHWSTLVAIRTTWPGGFISGESGPGLNSPKCSSLSLSATLLCWRGATVCNLVTVCETYPVTSWYIATSIVQIFNWWGEHLDIWIYILSQKHNYLGTFFNFLYSIASMYVVYY